MAWDVAVRRPAATSGNTLSRLQGEGVGGHGAGAQGQGASALHGLMQPKDLEEAQNTLSPSWAGTPLHALRTV